ncbi:MAG: TIGR00159 family protein [Candidatus Zixiibacteriota bacterium]|nr:MAG: TIGR00159 family protein [candidate division Zixibacteria bacterium]
MLAFFISIRLIDVLDILLVAFLLYQVFKLLKDSIATYIFIGFFFIYLVWLIVKALNMEMLSLILGQFMGVGIIALIVVFQQELRRFLLMIGRKYFANINIHFIEDIIKAKSTIQTEQNHLTIDEIIKATTELARTKTGAIMVVSDFLKLNNFVETGVVLNATVNHQTLISIFFKNNPLHDGAVIIHRNKILAAKVILPINNEILLNEKYGTRHRSALSMNIETDVPVIVVSEETGNISIANHEVIKKVSPKELEEILNKLNL